MRANGRIIRLFAPLFAGAVFFFALPARFSLSLPGSVPSVRAERAYALSRAETETTEGPENPELRSCPAGKRIRARIPKNVTVDGLSVGGKKTGDAERLVRRQIAEKTPVLVVTAPSGKYEFRSPEIGFSDDVSEILASAKRGGRYETTVKYRLCGEADAIERICADNRVRAIDAETHFSKEGFTFEAGRTGVAADGERLKREIDEALRGKATDGYFPEVTLKTVKIVPKITLSKAKADAVKLSSFTTYFNTDDVSRSANIALAAEKIDGVTLSPQEEFSFNATVGPRTKERGFKEAKVISCGEFIVGTGGGVCQVSTTLYNAALTSGMEITVRRPHSLAVSYVEPSRDAMVSSLSDFRFKNVKSFPVYISAKVKGNSLTVSVYGRDEGYSYRVVSRVTGEIPPPAPEEKPDETGVIREGRSGITSVAYLEIYRYGRLTERKKVREDSYAPVRGIIGTKKPEEPEKPEETGTPEGKEKSDEPLRSVR